MRQLFLAAAVLVCSMLFVSAAAGDTMTFAWSGTGLSTSGTFTGTPTTSGTWQVTSATGSFNGTAITGVWSTSNNGNIFAFNNKVYWPGPTEDIYGVVATLANGDLVNFCYDSGCGGAANTYTAIVWDRNTGISFLNASVAEFGAPVPEPGTLVLLGSGLLGLGGLLRRRLI